MRLSTANESDTFWATLNPCAYLWFTDTQADLRTMQSGCHKSVWRKRNLVVRIGSLLRSVSADATLGVASCHASFSIVFIHPEASRPWCNHANSACFTGSAPTRSTSCYELSPSCWASKLFAGSSDLMSNFVVASSHRMFETLSAQKPGTMYDSQVPLKWHFLTPGDAPNFTTNIERFLYCFGSPWTQQVGVRNTGYCGLISSKHRAGIAVGDTDADTYHLKCYFYWIFASKQKHQHLEQTGV